MNFKCTKSIGSLTNWDDQKEKGNRRFKRKPLKSCNFRDRRAGGGVPIKMKKKNLLSTAISQYIQYYVQIIVPIVPMYCTNNCTY